MRRLCQRLSYVMAVMLISAFVTGCATQAPRVNCGGRLEPINAPAPAATPLPAQAVPVP